MFDFVDEYGFDAVREAQERMPFEYHLPRNANTSHIIHENFDGEFMIINNFGILDNLQDFSKTEKTPLAYFARRYCGELPSL